MKVEEISHFQEFDRRRFVSKLIYDSERIRVVLFCLEPGQEITPHTSPSEVVFYGVEGMGKAMVGQEKADLVAQKLVFCPPEIPHGLKAETKLVVLALIVPPP